MKSHAKEGFLGTKNTQNYAKWNFLSLDEMENEIKTSCEIFSIELAKVELWLYL